MLVGREGRGWAGGRWRRVLWQRSPVGLLSQRSCCSAALARRAGLRLEPKDRERLLKNCKRSCGYECTKSGKAHDFATVYRP